MNERFQRLELLITDSGMQILQRSHVVVVGVGGVGSYACEALIRSGIGKLTIIDKDVVSISNCNRQLIALTSTLDQPKVEVMKQRAMDIAPDCIVKALQAFYTVEMNEQLFHEPIDFLIDAIDTVSAKMDLIQACQLRGIPFISSTGMANRFDGSQIYTCDLMKTQMDPLAKVMRTQYRKRHMRGKVPVIVSREQPFVQREIMDTDSTIRKERIPPASTAFVPSAAGLLAASVAVRTLLHK